jgi:hypothetical protein
MSLDFDFKDMIERVGREEFDRITTSPQTRGQENMQWHPVTDCLIWATMPLDLGEITEKNVDEWTWRMSLYQRLRGPYLKSKDGAFRITRKDIEQHIGMVTNVITEPRSKWLKKVLKDYRCFHEAKNFRRDAVGNSVQKSAWECCEDLHEKYMKAA